MGKVISATALRSHLSTLLDELQAGESHFIIERNNEEVAVLLNMTKFQEIMQTLELLNNLELIDVEEVTNSPAEFPEPLPVNTSPTRTHTHRLAKESPESAAARLGIRVVK